jgi:hypothetical protein
LRSQRADEDVTAVISTVVEIHEDVFWMKNKLAAVSGDVAMLSGDVAMLKSDVAGLKSDVATLKGDVAGLSDGARWTKRALSALLAAQGVSVAPDHDDVSV